MPASVLAQAVPVTPQEINRLPVQDQCSWRVNTFMAGVSSREEGRPRVIKPIDTTTLKEMIEHGEVKVDGTNVTMPPDAMYAKDLDKASVEFQKYFAYWVFQGWDWAEQAIEQFKSRMPPEDDNWKGVINYTINQNAKIQKGNELFGECGEEYGSKRAI